MKQKKIILLLDKDKNEEILDCIVPFIREYSSNVYFLYVIEIPVKYEIPNKSSIKIFAIYKNLAIVHELSSVILKLKKSH